MAWSALGDSAWLFTSAEYGPAERLSEVLDLAGRLAALKIPTINDVVTSYDTLAVHFAPDDGGEVWRSIENLIPSAGFSEILKGPRIDTPVAYGGESGPDLVNAAQTLGMEADQLIRMHVEAEFTVAALGFSPGFPYLAGLPPGLEIPRRATPRPVAAGSVAIAGTQAGIYPCDSQGGWHVIGRTPVRMFDPESQSPALLNVGDRVRFTRVETVEMKQCDPCVARRENDGDIEVLDVAGMVAVQDLGRCGWQHLGVSPSGAADPVMAVVANRLVGNPDDAAVLECTMFGPRLRMRHASCVAWVGWNDGRAGRPWHMAAGEEIDLRRRSHSLRGYLAVAGGFDLPSVLGSRSTDLRAGFGGFGGRLLRSGDRLPVGRPARIPQAGNWCVRWPHVPAAGELMELRFVPGVQHFWFPEKSHRRFRESVFQISPMSDRMGARLDGSTIDIDAAAGMRSQPVVAGSVQVPPDGRPILLLAERQTIGGYPQIAHVISADLPKLARAWPGTRIRFSEVTLAEARTAWRARMRDLSILKAGLELKNHPH